MRWFFIQQLRGIRGESSVQVKGVRAKGSIKCGTDIKSLTHFLPVAKTWKESGEFKGVDEINIVYDGTKYGLNKAVHVLWFPMPTLESHLRVVRGGTYMMDYDVGEIFLNFMMGTSPHPHTRVALNYLLPKEALAVEGNLREYWEIIMMCYSASSYFVTKDMMVIDKSVREGGRGGRSDPSNSFK